MGRGGGGGWQVDDGVRIPSATSAPVTREANPKNNEKIKKKLFSVPRSLLFTVTAELSGLHTHTRETLCVSYTQDALTRKIKK
jgi:hypothetical protein